MESAIRYLLIFLSANESVIGRVSDYVYNDKISDPEYDTWLKNYRSPDPKHQEYCLSILTTHNGSSAQFSQVGQVFVLNLKSVTTSVLNATELVNLFESVLVMLTVM